MTAIISTLIGAAIGAGVALALYVLGFAIELLNCACAIITCNCDADDAIPGIWNWGTFLSVLLFCTIAGAVVGLIYGIIKLKIASNEKARQREAEYSAESQRQRIKWAGEVKEKALNVANKCDKNVKQKNPLISPTNISDSEMNAIIEELAQAAELKGKIDSMAAELKSKGGVSK